jgi:hypothetical protein
MLHNMYVHTSMWAIATSTAVYHRNGTFSRALGTAGEIPITLSASASPDASTFRVLGCAAFAKTPDAQRQNLDPKSFRGVLA